jgi:hypothetical protein
MRAIPHFRLPRAVREVAIDEVVARHHAPGFVSLEVDDASDEEEGFTDADRYRRDGRGFYVFVGAEARSRRVDLRDPDPGEPIPLDEADPDVDAVVLDLAPS